MAETSEIERRAVRFWGGDPMIAAMLEARPGTKWFDEVVAALDRREISGLEPVLLGADPRVILRERGVTANDLATRLGVPFEVSYAIGTGWRRNSTRALFTLAESVGVPVAEFVRDEHFRLRPRVRIYRTWLDLEPDQDRG